MQNGAEELSIGSESQQPPPDPPQNWAEVRPLLRSIVRPATYASLLRPGEPIAMHQPISMFVHELVALDMPTARMTVTAAKIEEWGVSWNDVLAAGRENIAGLHPPGANVPGTEGAFFDADQSSYITSAILTPGWLASFARPDGPRPIAFMPTEDTLIIGNDGPEDGPKFFEMAEQMYCEADRPVSPEAFTVCAGQVVSFDKAGPHPLRGRAVRARACAAVCQYGEQADFLKHVYEEELIECFVAATKVFDAGYGKTSAAVWGEGVIYDLPEVDYVFFVNNDCHFAVPFSVVADVVGIMPSAGFFPPRYRVTGWPEPNVMEALRFHAVALPPG
jgi:hypothetical protein